MKKHKVSFPDLIELDDIIPLNFQNHIENLLKDSNFPWYYQEEVAYVDNGSNHIPNIGDNSYGFFHLVYVKEINQQSRILDLLFPLIYTICEKAQVKEETLTRVRLGLITKNGNTVHHTPHIDSPIPHTTLIYYPMDSDGDTYFFDKIYGSDEGNLNRYYRITPKKGKAVVFNGLRYHASSNPINYNSRIVLNINLI